MKTPFPMSNLVVIVISVAINILGNQLSSVVNSPIFFDSIGSIIAALVAGPWVALFTGLLSSLLNGLVCGPIVFAFVPVSMMIGFTAGLLAQVGLFRTLPRVILSGVTITLVLILVAVPIRVYMFGGTSANSSDFFITYLHTVDEGLFLSVSFSVIAANLIDKVLSVIIAWLLIRHLPQTILRYCPQIALVR